MLFNLVCTSPSSNLVTRLERSFTVARKEKRTHFPFAHEKHFHVLKSAFEVAFVVVELRRGPAEHFEQSQEPRDVGPVFGRGLRIGQEAARRF